MKTLLSKTIAAILAALVIPVLLATPAAAEEKNSKDRTPRRDAEFTLRVIEASTGAGANDAAALVPSELKSLLKYDRYALLDSAMVRGTEGKSMKLTFAGNMAGKLEFELDSQATLATSVEVSHRPMVHDVKLLETETRIKSGETVVLGASRMKGGGNSLIVLLTAKLLP